jgi:hypothetical protein
VWSFSLAATKGGRSVSLPLGRIAVHRRGEGRSYYEPSLASSQQSVSQPENITRLLVLRLVVTRTMQRRGMQCDENKKQKTKRDCAKQKQEAA